MKARVVGGLAALLVWGALLACDFTLSRVPRRADPTAHDVAAAPAGDEAKAAEAASVEAKRVETSPVEAVPIASTLAQTVSTAGHEPSRLVLVTIDGVRWEDVFVGTKVGRAPSRLSEAMTPNLKRLVGERGVALGGPGCAHDVRASGPSFVSLPGYLEMFTGKPSACWFNGCAPVDVMTVIDEAKGASHREADVAVFASWDKYAHAVARNRKAIVLSAGAHAPSLRAAADDPRLRSFLESGTAHAGYPGDSDYRPDVHTAHIALRYLETQKPRLLVVGLGDPDELAHRGDIAGYRRAIARADDFIGELDRTLARMGEEGRNTAVLVTTDHGRAHSLRDHGARYPESQRVFVAAYGAGISHRGVACPSSPIRLAHIAGAVRSLLALDTDEPGPLAGEIVADVRSVAN